MKMSINENEGLLFYAYFVELTNIFEENSECKLYNEVLWLPLGPSNQVVGNQYFWDKFS